MGRTGPVLALLSGSEPSGVPQGAARYGCFRTGRRDERGGDRLADRADAASGTCHVAWVASSAGARVEPAGLIARPEGSCRDFRARDRRMSDMSSARRNDGVRQAVAARERGRAKVRSATTTVTVASVVTAGALALALPGSANKTTSSGSTSTGTS